MKILLTHGYFLEEDEKEQHIMKPYVPLGILYIAAYLEAHGHPNEVFDSTFTTLQQLQHRLLSGKPDVVGIYTNLMTKLNVLRIVSFIKNEPELEHVRIVLGGPEVRNHAEHFLMYGVDVIVFGEGEQTMLELVRHIGRGEPLHDVAGICFMDHARMVTTRERALNRDYDSLPFPARNKTELQLYIDAWKKRHGYSSLSISTMRGCPYTCRWCSRAVYGQSYRRRKPVLVVDEIIMLQQEYSFDNLWFVDDVFTISHKWLDEFAHELEQKNIVIRYECISRADRLNEEVIKTLKRSGCFRVWIGAESGSQKIIDAMDRRVDVHRTREVIQMVKQYGMEAGTFIMLGYPGETEDDIKETIAHLKSSLPDQFTITVAYPIKGTPLYRELEKDFLNPRPWASGTDRDIDFRRTYKRRYYDFAVRWVMHEVSAERNRKQNRYLQAFSNKLSSFRNYLQMQMYK